MALVAALAVGAASCGTGDDSASPTLATQDDTSGDQVAEPEGDSADEPAAEPDGAAPSDGDAAPDGEQAGPETPIANLFPDIDVVDIADGSTVNLATELGGGDKATLLWFFAPH